MNVFIIALYVVQVFTHHEICLAKSEQNFTILIEFGFKIGLAVVVVEFVNTNLIGIYLKYRECQ